MAADSPGVPRWFGFSIYQEKKKISNKAFIFPGQGSQFVGMAKDLYEKYEHVREVYETANSLLGFDLANFSFAGPEEDLKQTRITQPAIFVHSAVLVDALYEKQIKPAMVAGHSLGEFTALYAAKALTFKDALTLVKVRAELMQRAGEINPGTMAAVIGLQPDDLKAVCAEASAAGIVQIANLNSPTQLVISGSVAGVERAMALAQEKGAKRVIQLVVSGAFHSPLMDYASEGLNKALDEIDMRPAKIPVYSNVDALPVTEPEALKRNLSAQLTSPVRWIEIVQKMLKDGATDFYEIGPGSVLTGLLRRIDRQAVGRAINSVESLEKI